MPKDKSSQNKDFSNQSAKNFDQNDADKQNKQGYQEGFEKAKSKVDLTEKIYIYLTSFRVKAHAMMFVILYFPMLMTLALFAGDSLQDIMYFNTDDVLDMPTIIFNYTNIIFFSWIPSLLFTLMESNYTNWILGFFSNLVPINALTAPMIYLWVNAIVSWVMLWTIALLWTLNVNVKPKFWSTIVMSPRTLGEKWEYIFSKSVQKMQQSLRDDRSIEKGAKLLTNLKFFLKEVDAGVTTGWFKSAKYKNDFTQFLPVYKLFFNRQDSIRANMLAGRLNKRWEEIKYKKQELQTEAKFFSLIESGYKFGKTPRDDVKMDIVNNIPYFFVSNSGSIFQEKKEIFLPENRNILKRNLYVLLIVTIVLKNQILPPILRFIKKKYNIDYNRNEMIFLSNSRRIFREYRKNGLEVFDKFHNYDLPISLQYDYPYNVLEKKLIDSSKEVSESINEFGKTQLAVYGYVNEINSLLPKLEDFDLPQPAFNAIFIKNLNNISEALQRYIIKRLSIDPVFVAAAMIEKDSKFLEEKIKDSIAECILNPLVIRMPLLKDPDLQQIYEESRLSETISKKIKINETTNNLILQQMNLTSYSVFKNELNNLSLGQVNYTIDHLYKKLGLNSSIHTTLESIFDKYKVSYTLKSIDKFLNIKEKELISLL